MYTPKSGKGNIDKKLPKGIDSLQKHIFYNRGVTYTTFPENGDTPEHRVSYKDDNYFKTMDKLDLFVDEIKHELGFASRIISNGGLYDYEKHTYTYWQKRCVLKLCCCNVWTYNVERTIHNIHYLLDSPSKG
jgi:hypothetical protein